MNWIWKCCVLGVVLVLAAAQSEPAADPGPINVPPESSPAQPPAEPPGRPFSDIAATEFAQGTQKPKAPLSRGPDSWTPLGKTGDGGSPPWEPLTGQTNQNLPYDTSKSQMTIGEQIMQKRQQQQQQQPQQYDIFGLPINNNADPFGDLFGGLFGSSSTSADPVFGGLFGGSNQGGAFGGTNQGGLFGGSNSGHNPAGNMLQTMLLMQLLGGGDAPDPPAQGRGRGRGRQATPPSALEQLLRLEEIRMMRSMQQDRVNRNRMHQQNQRGGPMGGTGRMPLSGPPIPPFDRFGPGPRRQVYDNTQSQNTYAEAPIPKPPPTRTSYDVRPNFEQASNRGRTYISVVQGQHPEILDRRHIPTPAPTPSGQEPVEREHQAAQGHTPQQGLGQAQGQAAVQQEIEGGRGSGGGSRSHSTGRVQPTSYPAPITRYRYRNPPQDQPWMLEPQHQVGNLDLGGSSFSQSSNQVPRNLRQLARDPLFQRQLRTSGSHPGANPADVRADQADMMADHADNLQAMSPLQRLMHFGMGSMATGSGVPSPSSGASPLASLLGGGSGQQGLFAMSLLG